MLTTETVLVEPTPPAFSAVNPPQIKHQLMTLLDQNRRHIDAVTSQSSPGWELIAQPIDKLSDRLNKFWAPISHLNSVLNTDELREAYNESIPELSKYATDVGQNRALFDAYVGLQQSPEFDSLTEAQRKSVENTIRDFRLSGVNLTGKDKAHYKAVSQRLAELSSQFSDHVLDATKAWVKRVEDVALLAGLPESSIALARQAAKTRDVPGYVITLDFPSYHAVMTFAEDRELRREVYEAFVTRASDVGPHAGEFDNSFIIDEILQLRLEKARLLGFDSFADYSLATKMATSADDVVEFLTDLADKSVTVAREEYRQLQRFALGRGLEKMEAWDVAYFSEQLKQNRFAISQEDLRPYFPVEKVVSGMFRVVERLFGISLEEVEHFDSYHEDLRCFLVLRNGTSIAKIYMDLFARENKRSGAWMADYAVRFQQDDGKVQKPIAFITCNFAPATEELPALLTHNDVTTLFHEFGHALHHTLTQVDCFDVSGINGVAWDAVELPSQFLENWCWEEPALELISGHYQTGKPLPGPMLEKMLAARNFQSAMTMVRQLEFALFDFRLHREFDGRSHFSVQALLNEIREAVAVAMPPGFNRFQHSFAHIFAGGYAAGYYSYKWAEVLASDAFSKFEENGVFDQTTGEQFLQSILEKGGSRDPMTLFIEFRGRPPEVDALLRHNGIS